MNGEIRWISTKQVAGHLAGWAIRQSPYPAPDHLTTVVQAFQELWPHADENGLSKWDNSLELKRAIHETARQIPEYMAWNERKNGRPGMGFVTRYSKTPADDDFIDLDALTGNVARSCWEEP